MNHTVGYEQLTEYAEQEIRRHFARHHRRDDDFRLQADIAGATLAVLDLWRKLVAPLANSPDPAVRARVAADDQRLDDLVIPF